MLLKREREWIVEYARRLRPDRLVTGVSGNLSVRAGDLVAISPSGLDYDAYRADLVCVVGLDGSPMETPLPPSTELPMHLTAYRETDAGAVVHTHSRYATVLGTLIDELPPIHYLLAMLGGPIRVATYATPGSEELARNMAAGLQGRRAVLLQNHGAIAIGESLERAYSNAITLETLCTLYYQAVLLGKPNLLSLEEIEHVGVVLRDYGKVSVG